jgi:UDP-sugar pyrophosphorylase
VFGRDTADLQAGLSHGGELAFVLVAGGLGERLGFSNIKVALPSEITTGKMYLQLYIESILAIQREAEARTGRTVVVPFAIMTSGDTHARTAELLKKHKNFGMTDDQITLLQQEKVASLIDNTARIASNPDDPFEILTKPHGHGDVHYLLHTSALAQHWLEQGKRQVCGC